MSTADDSVDVALSRLCKDLRERGVAKLPAERALAERLNSTRGVVRRVLNKMESNGEIYRVRGRAGGAFLAGVPTTMPSPQKVPSIAQGSRIITRDLTRAVGVPQMLSAQGYNAGTHVVRASIEKPSDEVSSVFSNEDLVVSVVRIRYADGEALSLDHAYLPAARFPGLLHHPLNASLYQLIQTEYGVSISESQESIEVTLAPEHVASFLDCEPGVPLLKVTREARDEDGSLIEYSIDLFRADRTRLTVTSRNSGPFDPAFSVTSEESKDDPLGQGQNYN